MSDKLIHSIKEYLSLFLLNLKVKMRNFAEYIKVLSNYYSNFSFAKMDAYLVFSYLFNNPFTVSKRFLMSRHEKEIHTYGETPLTTLDYIAKECRITPRDTVFELGCGRARTCFWLNQFIGCNVVGVDHVPEFIKRANQVKAKFDVKGVQFRLEDLLKTDLKGATVIYLYGTCFPDAFIEALVQHLSQLPKGTKIITVSYTLIDYTKAEQFEVLKRFPAQFTWGPGDVYLQVKK